MQDADGMIAVCINYRLGMFGLMPSKEIPANLSLKYQPVALRWVQMNITLFGANPKRVTVMGEFSWRRQHHAALDCRWQC